MTGTLLDTALIAAVVSAAVTAFGWFASHWSEKRLEESRRNEKINDFQTALLAEIIANLDRFANIDLDAHKREMSGAILARSRGKAPFTPFVPRYAATFVFEEIVKEIHILPSDVIDEVVEYYKWEYRLYQLVEDLRDPRYASLSAARKAAVYDDYVWLIEQTRDKGKVAENALNATLGRRHGTP